MNKNRFRKKRLDKNPQLLSNDNIRGKTRQELIELFRDKVVSDVQAGVLVCRLPKTWFMQKETYVFIEFDSEGKADTILKNRKQ